MELLKQERMTLERYLPGLDEALAKRPLLALESPGSDGIRLFCEAGGPVLLLPCNYGGLGATALDAIHIQRAIASRSPSLAIAATMHHYSVASLLDLIPLMPGLETSLLEPLARERPLIASGFAEGYSGRNFLVPTMKAERAEGGWIVNGSKKPCSLTWSMGMLTASVALPSSSNGGDDVAVVVIPADAEGIERRKFWNNWLLAGAESDEVVLHNVFVPDELVFNLGDTSELDPASLSGFIWFEMLVSAAYLGVASALVERVITAKRGKPNDRALLAIELEGAMSALAGLALQLTTNQADQTLAAQTLFVRYAVERTVERASASATELLGGMAFIQDPEISYLFAASRVLAFHPPSRISMSDALDDYLANGTLRIG